MSNLMIRAAWALMACMSGFSVALAAPIALKVSLADRSNCGIYSPFFGKSQLEVRLTLLDASSTQLATEDHVLTDPDGSVTWDPKVSIPSGAVVRADCEGSQVQASATVLMPGETRVLLTLPNRRPAVQALQAFAGSQEVVASPPGSTLTLRVSASDPDAGANLSYAWKATAGRITVTSKTGSIVQWTLPTSGGLHFAYVLVSDGRGGYRERRVAMSTDVGAIVLPVAQDPPPFRMSNLLPAYEYNTVTQEPAEHGRHFLSFSNFIPGKPLDEQRTVDDQRSACAYYAAIGADSGLAANNTCDASGVSLYGSNHIPAGAPYARRFDLWLKTRGFFDLPADRIVSARYKNAVDLGLEREMHMAVHTVTADDVALWPALVVGDEITAYYVCNYPPSDTDQTNNDTDKPVPLTNAIVRNKLVACVAMEHSRLADRRPKARQPMLNGDKPFIKFYIFGPAGQLLPSVNLDNRGEKYVPGTCTVCHGGSRAKFPTQPEPALVQATTQDVHFLPFDLNNLQYSDTAGFRLSDQHQSFKAMNCRILKTESSTTTRVSELIRQWYFPLLLPTTDSLGVLGDFALCMSFTPITQPPTGKILYHIDAAQRIPPEWNVVRQIPGWPGAGLGPAMLYRATISKQCRTCHVAVAPQVLSQPIWDTASFAEKIASYYCGQVTGHPDWTRWIMPNAALTQDKIEHLQPVIHQQAYVADSVFRSTGRLPSWSPACRRPPPF